MYVLIEAVEFCLFSLSDWRNAIADPIQQRKIRLLLRNTDFPIVFSPKQAWDGSLLKTKILYCHHEEKIVEKDKLIPHDFTLEAYTEWEISGERILIDGSNQPLPTKRGRFQGEALITEGLAAELRNFAESS